MGTRADFYKTQKDEPELVWLGSIAFDGYVDGISESVLHATTVEEYEERLEEFFGGRDDVTFPKEGWPWPWNNSETTDCAYCFNGDGVMYYKGKGDWCGWGDAMNWDDGLIDEPPAKWIHRVPDMSDKKNVQWGKKSGMIIITGR